jgi:hypothetical protein
MHTDEETFKRMSWKAQNEVLEPHLKWVLSHITEPQPTTYIAWAMSERTGYHEDFIARLLLRRFAAKGFYATQDGAEAHAYGKAFTRWRWHPLPTQEV